MEELDMVTAMCRAADDGGLPAWAHWACLDAPAPDTPDWLRTDCGCHCHTELGEAVLPPVPEEYLVQVPQHRRGAVARRARRSAVA
ncbi:hypothetical protein H7827_26175 [Streptomyces sp. JH002]|uniref:hypothetical protein n=1 Tax=Streptomyces sp. JH002 TaxID=2763259 RepID=UPI003D80815E